MSTFLDWKDRLSFWAVTGFALAAVSWSCWATLAILDRPYIEDRKLIQERLDQAKADAVRLVQVIEKNTTAINLLSIAMAEKGK